MKTVLITGAGRGIGYSLVQQFINSDYKVISISRNISQLEKLKNGNLEILMLDLVKDYNKALDSINNLCSHLDILINNAGVLINKPLVKTSDSDINYVLNTNLILPFKLIRDLVPKFKHGSHIVNIGSMGGFQGSTKFNGLSIYSASKGGLAILSECLAEEFKELNISINCLALGAVQTEMLNEAFPGFNTKVTSDNMASWIIDFAINGNHFFNGKVIPISLNTP